MNLLTLILAAGKGTRMKSDIPKVLHPIAGKSMLNHILDTVKELNSKIVGVVGYKAEKVKKEIKNDQIEYVTQKKQLGTGHAVLQAREYIKNHEGPVLVLYGDIPLLSRTTLSSLLDSHLENKAGVSVLTAAVDNPSGYGRIIRDKKGFIKKIVEEVDASTKEKKVKEINTGVYCFNSNFLNQALDNLKPDNAQKEYYLTDAVSYINQKKGKVLPVPVKDNNEIIGVNDRIDLAKAEKIYRKKINNNFMKKGVSIIDPDTTYIEEKVEIAPDVVIYPFTYIEGNTRISRNTVVGPHSRLVNTELEKNVEIKSNCIIKNSIIKNNCSIGPFAHIRPGSNIEEGAKVGDFVELKKAQIDKKSKVPHLSYVGDADIGKNTNIGAGTVFANYDGENKHKTIIGDSCFIGSNTTLIAPVKVGDRGKTGAGAVVTKDVDNDTTVIGVPAKVYKKNK